MKWLLTLVAWAFFLPLHAQNARTGNPDRELLDKAIDYFVSRKYHEALLLFEHLDEHYTLNPRYKAYMGYCYYVEWEYDTAAESFSVSMPRLAALSPHELSVYYFAWAESLFNLSRYDEAIAVYEQHLVRCYPNERADALYRLGFIYLFRDDKPLAWEYFSAACSCYQYYQPEQQARIRQLRHMALGLEAELQKATSGE